ncbi:type II toxin-antitoxin system Phd/YefM family antitoxin [bacterium]|nr:type II toxin-antitoxin system Phd/YefM family antitoxin [bacterium]
MRQVNMHEAKTHFSKLVRLVEQGEEVIIARAGEPVARLVAPARATQDRKPGVLRGGLTNRADFEAPAPEVERAFRDRPMLPEFE